MTNPSASNLPPLLPANSQSPTAQDQMTSSFRVQPSVIAPAGSEPPFTTSSIHNHSYNSSAGPPVRPRPPLDIFYEEQRASDQGEPGEEQEDRVIRIAWNNLTTEQQAPYHQLYEEQMRKYEVEMDEYKRTRRDQQVGGGVFKPVNPRDDEIKQEV